MLFSYFCHLVQEIVRCFLRGPNSIKIGCVPAKRFDAKKELLWIQSNCVFARMYAWFMNTNCVFSIDRRGVVLIENVIFETRRSLVNSISLISVYHWPIEILFDVHSNQTEEWSLVNPFEIHLPTVEQSRRKWQVCSNVNLRTLPTMRRVMKKSNVRWAMQKP